MNIEQVPSPNFNDRKAPIDMLVLHYTGMASGEAALERMCDAQAEVSAHYMVWEDGRVTQMVDEANRAWHAGVGSWQGDTDLNSCSVGIEIVNGGHNVPLADGTLPPYPDAQIEAVIALSQGVIKRHNIPQTRIVGHSDIAPSRKEDPGEHFPWVKLAGAGLGVWPVIPRRPEAAPFISGNGLFKDDQGPAVKRLQENLISIGYGLGATGQYSEETEAVVRAFQRRWIQDGVTGQANQLTLGGILAVKVATEAR